MSTSPEGLLGRPLNEIEQKFAPSKLFVASGEGIPLPGPRVAIVGSRKASSQGILLAQEIASFLARKGIIIVSGLAEGIDTASHEAAIKDGATTVAVLGTPLDRSYPAKNDWLEKTIMREHWAVSQFPVGHPTEPKNFVIRNRTMAHIRFNLETNILLIRSLIYPNNTLETRPPAPFSESGYKERGGHPMYCRACARFFFLKNCVVGSGPRTHFHRL